jgi:hypothetical protein
MVGPTLISSLFTDVGGGSPVESFRLSPVDSVSYLACGEKGCSGTVASPVVAASELKKRRRGSEHPFLLILSPPHFLNQCIML